MPQNMTLFQNSTAGMSDMFPHGSVIMGGHLPTKASQNTLFSRTKKRED